MRDVAGPLAACRACRSCSDLASSAGPEIERLISLLAKLPGLGPRSARRAALALLKRRDQLLAPLAQAMADAAARVQTCTRLRLAGHPRSLRHLRRRRPRRRR